jgi:succinyl-CoA synthetase alpha subunit
MILLDENSRVVIQGITGNEGSFHTREAVKFGTKVVAGVTPGKGGTTLDGIPVYNRVVDAVEREGANASGIFVPAPFAPDAILEAIEAGIELIVCMTEGIPVLDMVRVKKAIRGTSSVLIGPNCPGITSPGIGKIGFMPNFIHLPGNVGVISRSGTLTYEVIYQLTRNRIGQSTSIGIGGDPIVGSTFLDLLKMFEEDVHTELVVLIGEIGGSQEEEASDFIRKMSKPVVGFIAGKTAPPGKRMGHAGAIISRGKGTAEEKILAWKDAGVEIVENPAEVGKAVKKLI